MRAGSGTLAAVAAAIEVPIGASRVQLFPGYGTWKGRNGAGPYQLADQAHAECVIAATAAAQGPVDLHFDYDHQAALAPGVAGTSKAAGWFKSLSADADGIWAEGVEWTATASAAIEAREYRYASPYFLHDRAGRITRIINAALTNTPNFNLQAVAASALTGEDMEPLQAIAAALGLPAETTLDQAVETIKGLTGAKAALSATASALGLAAGVDGAAIASAAASAKAAVLDPAKFVPVEQLTAVNARLIALEGDKHEAAVASAIKAGKLAPALKPWAMDPENRAAFASFIETAPVVLAPGATEPGKLDAKSDVLSDEEKAIASSMGIDHAAFLASRKEMAA